MLYLKEFIFDLNDNGLQIYDDVQKFPVGGAICTVCSQLVESSG